ncbi:MAG: WD40/YVTN/BNR-like repeat-containing protein [Acidimicrobiia bacterium]
MPEARSTTRTGPRRAGTRRPRQSWWQRNRAWVAAAGLGAALLVAVAVSANGDANDGAATSGPAGAGFVGGDFHSLVADPTTPGRVFVGGHEAVSASADGGRTWRRVESLDDADAMGWGFTDRAVYVSGHPGIRRSTDGGVSFDKANEGLPDTDIHAFGASASALYGAGPATGVIASTDGGRTWSARTTAHGQSFFGRILTDPADDEHLIAADARAGVVESADGGRSWRRLGGPPSAVWVSASGGSLYASGPRGAAQSADGGKSWEDLALPNGATLVEAHPSEPATLYAGVHDGRTVQVLVSRDGGVSWSAP